jgi:hypothetical protein
MTLVSADLSRATVTSSGVRTISSFGVETGEEVAQIAICFDSALRWFRLENVDQFCLSLISFVQAFLDVSREMICSAGVLNTGMLVSFTEVGRKPSGFEPPHAVRLWRLLTKYWVTCETRCAGAFPRCKRLEISAASDIHNTVYVVNGWHTQRLKTYFPPGLTQA